MRQAQTNFSGNAVPNCEIEILSESLAQLGQENKASTKNECENAYTIYQYYMFIS